MTAKPLLILKFPTAEGYLGCGARRILQIAKHHGFIQIWNIS